MSSPVCSRATAGAHGEDLALLGLLLGGVGDDQAAGGGLLGLAGLDDDAVFEGLKVHVSAPPLAVLAVQHSRWASA